MAPGDVLLLLATLTLVGALAYPRLVTRALKGQIDTTAIRVEAVRDAALRHRSQAGSWPVRQEAGRLPPEVRRYLPPGFTFEGEGHVLTWQLFERVVANASTGTPPLVDIPAASDNPETLTPPAPDSTAVSLPVLDTLAAISVHADDPRVLAALLDHFGPARSFIRDDTWTLVLAEGAGNR